jgi:hypothetical protein
MDDKNIKIEAVSTLLILGITNREMFNILNTDHAELGILESEVDELIEKSMLTFGDTSDEQNLNISLNRLQMLFYRNIKIQDYKAANDIEKQIRNLNAQIITKGYRKC